MMDNSKHKGKNFYDFLSTLNAEFTNPIETDVAPSQRFHQGVHPRSRYLNQANEKLQRNDKSAW